MSNSRRYRYEVVCCGLTVSRHRLASAAQRACDRWQAKLEREMGREVFGDGAYGVIDYDQ